VQFNQTAVLLLLCAGPVRAQCPAARLPRAAALAGGYAASQTLAIALRHDDWWQPPGRRFHVVWGGSASRQQDALLHAAVAYHAAQAARLAWRWACVSDPAAAWLGAATGLAVSLPKEIGDGFHQNGFSGSDLGWSIGGAVLPALRHTVPALRVVALKVWYWPSAEYRNRTGALPQLENDYAGQRYYLSLNPARAGAGGWPRWLGIALGHAVPHWVSRPPRDQWYIALDVDFRGLPVRGAWWRALAAALDQVHLPLPGLRVSGGVMTLGVY
jgi:hypothetical protein